MFGSPTTSRNDACYKCLNCGNSREKQIARNQAAIAMFDSFLYGDEDEQTATWEIAKKALDENRPEGSKLYP